MSAPPVPRRRRAADVVEELQSLLADGEWIEFEREGDVVDEDADAEQEAEIWESGHHTGDAEGSEAEAVDVEMVCSNCSSTASFLACLDGGSLREGALDRLQESLPHLLRVRAELMEPTLSGQVSDEERERLLGLQEALANSLVAGGVAALCVAREVSQGWCNWDLYVAKGGAAVHCALASLQEEEYTYALDMALSLDRGWRHFAWLQPTADERLYLLCKRLLSRLLEGGDGEEAERCPAVARPVWHVLRFSDEESVGSFAADAFAAGFLPVTHPSVEAHRSSGHEVCCFMRRDEVTLPQIFEVVQNVAAAAEHHGGAYCAWYTTPLQSIPREAEQEEGLAAAEFARGMLERAEGQR